MDDQKKIKASYIEVSSKWKTADIPLNYLDIQNQNDNSTRQRSSSQNIQRTRIYLNEIAQQSDSNINGQSQDLFNIRRKSNFASGFISNFSNNDQEQSKNLESRIWRRYTDTSPKLKPIPVGRKPSDKLDFKLHSIQQSQKNEDNSDSNEDVDLESSSSDSDKDSFSSHNQKCAQELIQSDGSNQEGLNQNVLKIFSKRSNKELPKKLTILQLRRMQTLKIDLENITQSQIQKSKIYSTTEKQNQRKISLQRAVMYLKEENVDIKNNEHCELALDILNKRKNKTKLEKQFILKILKCCSIFQKNKNVISDENPSLRILDWFSYQFMPKNTIVFNQGEYGNTYYIVLKGEVFCMIPDPDFKTKEKYSSDQFQKRRVFFTENPYTKTAEDINSQLKNQIKNQKFEIPSPGALSKDGSDSGLRRLEKDQFQLLIECFPMLKLVHVFKSGESFGDIALITNDRRTATLVCKEDTHFLTLTKEGYEHIIGVYESRVLEETINFLRQFSYFKNIVRSRLLQIHCWMKEQIFFKKNIIYKEGDLSNAVYFIRSGEVEISQATEISNDNKTEQSDTEEPLSSLSRNQYDKMLELNSVKKQKINKKNIKRVQLVILGANQYFGQDEVLDNNPKRNQSAQCLSQTAHVYLLPKQDMVRLNHGSLEKIRNEEKQKKQWKQDRLESIQLTNKQSSLLLKNITFGDNNNTKQDESYTPTSICIGTGRSISQLKPSASISQSSRTSIYSSADSSETNKYLKLEKSDKIVEPNHSSTPSERKRQFYVQTRHKSFNYGANTPRSSRQSTFSKYFEDFSNSQNFQETEQNQQITDKSKEYYQQNILKQDSFSPNRISKNLASTASQKIQLKQMFIGIQLDAPQTQQQLLSTQKGLNQNQLESIKEIQQQSLQTKSEVPLKLNTTDSNFKKQKLEIKHKNFKSLQNSPSNRGKKQINKSFSKQQQGETQPSFFSYQSKPQLPLFNLIYQNKPIHFTKATPNSNILSNQQQHQHGTQFISSQSSFQDHLNPHISTHLDYLKMVHQSLIAKEEVLNQLKQSSIHNNSSNKYGFNFQTPLLGDQGHSFQMLLHEDGKQKHTFSHRQINSKKLNQQKDINQQSEPLDYPQNQRNKSNNIQSQKIQSDQRYKINRSENNTPNSRPTSQQSIQLQFSAPKKQINSNQSSQISIAYQYPQQNPSSHQVSQNQSEESNSYQNPALSIFKCQIPFSQKMNMPNIQDPSFSSKEKKTKIFFDQSYLAMQMTGLKEFKQSLDINSNSQFSQEQSIDEQTNNKRNLSLQSPTFQQQGNVNKSIDRKSKNQRDQYFFNRNWQNKSLNLSALKNKIKKNQSMHQLQQVQQKTACLRYFEAKNKSNVTLPNICKGKNGTSVDLGSIIQKSLNSNQITANTISQISQSILVSPQKDKQFNINEFSYQVQINQDQSLHQPQNRSNNNSKSHIQSVPNTDIPHKKTRNLQSDLQNLIDFGNIGKKLKLEKILRNNKEKQLLNKLVEEQQAKVQQFYDIRNQSIISQQSKSITEQDSKRLSSQNDQTVQSINQIKQLTHS